MKTKTSLLVICSIMSLSFLAGCNNSDSGNGGNKNHICQHVCNDCGGCLDASCNDEACSTKCSCVQNVDKNIFEEFASFKVGETQTLTDSVLSTQTEVTVFKKADDSVEKLPVAIYVINHKNERTGTATDYFCVSKLLDEYVVVVLDYKNNEAAVSPNLEISAYKFNGTLTGGTFLDGINYNSKCMFVVPAGSLIKKDIVYYDLMKSAPVGWKEKTVSIWNSSAVQNAVTNAGGSYEAATTIDDIKVKNGDSLTATDANGDYKYLQYKMDIVYPVNPVEEAPLILSSSSADSKNTIRYNPKKQYRYQTVGFEFNGYAVGVYDHEYYPFMFSDFGWGHIEPNYTLQQILGNRSHTAAVRCAKYYADELGYSKTKVGVYGHSKSSWVSLLSDSNLTSCDPELMPENSFDLTKTAPETLGEQPYKVDKNGNPLNANITCIYHSMGAGTSRAKYYVDKVTVPTMIGCGENCEYNSWSKFWETSGDACVMKYFTNANPNFIDLPMYGVGHEYPYVKNDIKYDYNYYDAFRSFFNYHLKNGDVELFYSSIGLDHKLTSNDELFLQFNCVVDQASVEGAFKLLDSNEQEVIGTWTKLRQGNRYVFTPETALVDGETYKITLTNTVKDANNKHLNKSHEETFVFEEIKQDDTNYSSIEGSILADALVSTDSTGSNYGSSETLRIYRSLNGSYNRYSYLKFNLASLLDNANYATLSQDPDALIRLSFYVTAGENEICDALNVNLLAMPVSDADWNESSITWKTCKADSNPPGADSAILARSKGMVLQNTFAYDSETKIFSINVKFADLKDRINTTQGSLYGNITFCLFANGSLNGTEIGNSIRLASKENTSNPIPKIEFLYKDSQGE